MTKLLQVRVIKATERERSAQEAASSVGLNKSAHEAARDRAATVTNWIDEFRQKRQVECREVELLLNRHRDGGDTSDLF